MPPSLCVTCYPETTSFSPSLGPREPRACRPPGDPGLMGEGE